ncbi:hypothetical protein CA85_52370 [Allorhodopirellula solitaria]|uniref:Uncharacterized protein n=1 Tax=Allorhodopirellula solitaria TaxID=2527987 RepID=A0A5C5WP88_9BACT|nr:hypothetical protein CA85_52370 [Allorhodopirellula solitaria]
MCRAPFRRMRLNSFQLCLTLHCVVTDTTEKSLHPRHMMCSVAEEIATGGALYVPGAAPTLLMEQSKCPT